MNWIPFIATLEDGRDRITAAQLNGDGTLYVDWPALERMAEKAPLVPEQRCEIVHLLLALRNRSFADAPRDFLIGEAAHDAA
jgi:hypothetical protein